jgi:Lar family restriction alleviation protein
MRTALVETMLLFVSTLRPTMANNQALLPCPFCGSEYDKKYGKPVLITDKRYKYTFYVEHDYCGCRGPYWTTPEHAIDAWNRRTS